jgi:hypothetical protein
VEDDGGVGVERHCGRVEPSGGNVSVKCLGIANLYPISWLFHS